jgi:hypothetical protein
LYVRYDDRNAPPVEVTFETQVAAEAQAGEADVIVPDLYGLSEAEAREALVDAGLAPDAITTIRVPAVGPTGRVVVQEPAKGTRNPAAAVIGLSQAATVPDIVGASVEDARNALELIGARVVEDKRYAPDATVGTVLEASPAPGQPASEAITIIVAAPPSAIFAADVSTVVSDCDDDDVNIGGTAYTASLSCSLYPEDEPSLVEYQVNALVDEVTATVGLVDGEEAATLRFRVLGDDGAVLWSRDVAAGTTEPLSIRTSGVQRFVFEVSVVGAPQIGGTEAAWGDLRFVGSADAMNGLATS